MLQNRLSKFLIIAILSLVFQRAYCQILKNQEIELSLVEGLGPRGVTNMIISSLDKEDKTTQKLLKDYNTDNIQGLEDKQEFAYIINKFQFYYQAFKNGDISKEYFYDQANTYQWSLEDSIYLSKTSLKNVIRILTGRKNGDNENYICIVDANQNGTYEDDVIRHIPKIRSVLEENISPIAVEVDFYKSGSIRQHTINIMPSFGYQGNLGISFFSFYLSRIKYKGQRFIICSDFLEQQSVYIIPDMPYFSQIPRSRHISDTGKVVLLKDTLNVSYNKHNNTVILTDEHGELAKMEIENASSAYKADVVNINVPYKNIQGNNLLNNESESLDKFKNKWRLLYFWSDNCGPCIQSLPTLNKISRNYSKQLEIIGIVDIFWEKENFIKILKENKVTWPNIESPKESKIRQFYAVQSYPTIYLINPDGEIVKNYLNTAELEDVLKNYLKN
jgi:thiol-disulfide isomerase/thioredoxin